MTPADLPAPIAAQLAALHDSDRRLVRTVDSLTEEEWRAPSLLPDWTRAHVIAHLALNAEGFAGALEGIDQGIDVPIYPSEAARDTEIVALAQRETAEVRERLFAATTRFREAVEALIGSQWDRSVLRLPEGPAWPAADLPSTRRREVEIHHADLGTTYTHLEWPTDFSRDLLDQVSGDHAAADSDRFAISAIDLDARWTVGAEEPVVTGVASALGWWLVGRGDGEGLTSNGGGLPRLGPWRRAPAVPHSLG